MAKISVQEIKDLMKSTGVGMMDCKNALTEADGNVDEAIRYFVRRVFQLRQRRARELLQRVSLQQLLKEMSVQFSK